MRPWGKNIHNPKESGKYQWNQSTGPLREVAGRGGGHPSRRRSCRKAAVSGDTSEKEERPETDWEGLLRRLWGGSASRQGWRRQWHRAGAGEVRGSESEKPHHAAMPRGHATETDSGSTAVGATFTDKDATKGCTGTKTTVKKKWPLRPSTGLCNCLHQESEANFKTSTLHAKSARNFREKIHTLYVKSKAIGWRLKNVRITTQQHPQCLPVESFYSETKN